MATGLSVDRVVRVTVNLSPIATPRRNFGVLCVAGDSPVIDALERLRFYTTLDAVADDFGLDAPEYQAAALYYAQSPRPAVLAVGRWIAEDSPAILRGGVAVTELAAWTAVEDGALDIEVDGVVAELRGLDFSSAANLNGVASVLSAALAGAGQAGAACVWDGGRFVVTTQAVGSTAYLGYSTAPGAGTDVGAMAGLTQALAYTPVPGADAETPAECAAALADQSGDWYGLLFASQIPVTDDALVAVAAFIEGAGKSRVLGCTVTDRRILSASFTTDLGSRLKALGLARSVVQYSANPYAVASLFGRAFSVNFSGNKTTITLKFKQQPGITAEALTESQAQVLEDKHVNVFVAYDNDTAILQEGVVSSGAFFDEIHGLDWLQNAVQTEVYNLLYTSKTKVPQTEQGVARIVARVAGVLDQAVANGLVAPGTWTADGFGQLREGDYLPSGYYIYSQPIVDQAQSEREQRKAPPIQVAAKLAGAVHSVDVQIDINR
jgi:hypothetical protein